MPTGYTYGIESGKIKTFKQFVLTCARSFGACIHMKDDSLDKPYRKRTIDDYYYKKQKELHRELDNLISMSEEKYAIKRLKELKKELADSEHSLAERRRLKNRYEKYRSLSQKLNLPLEYKNLSDFIKEQIEISIPDLSFRENYVKELNRQIETFNAKDELQEEIRNVQEELAICVKEIAEQNKHCEDSNNWYLVLDKALSEMDGANAEIS